MNNALFITNPCPVETAVQVIGGKWKPLILFYLLDDTKRFNELRRLLPPITPQMLTVQLRELERHGIVHRQVYAEVPARVEYSLTEVGRTLQPVLEAILQWGLSYLKVSPTTTEKINRSF